MRCDELLAEARSLVARLEAERAQLETRLTAPPPVQATPRPPAPARAPATARALATARADDWDAPTAEEEALPWEQRQAAMYARLAAEMAAEKGKGA
jgi:hypothetical protein